MVNGDCARRRCDTNRLLWLVAATLVALEAAATAGVVIDQQITMPDAQGAAKTVTRTTMIQGNRMKTISLNFHTGKCDNTSLESRGFGGRFRKSEI